MATLTGNTIASSYLTLLKLSSAAIGAGVSAKFIEDAAGTASALSLSTTRVGIGTAGPDYLLDIEASGTASMRVVATASNGDAALFLQAHGSGDPLIQFRDDADTEWTIGNDSTNDFFKFANSTDGTLTTDTRVTIDTAGKVGIGTIAPARLLDIENPSSGSDAHIRLGTNDANKDAIIELWTGEDNYGKTAIVAEGLNSNRKANLHFVVDTVSDENSYTLGTDTKMFISGTNGYVGIGTDGPNTSLDIEKATGPTLTLHAKSAGSNDSVILFAHADASKWVLKNAGSDDSLNVYDYYDGTVASHIDPGDNDWGSGSDLRIKKDINNIDSVLSGINSLRPVTWGRKYGKTDRIYPGLVAQEVKPHFPLVVSGTEDSFKEVTDENGHLTSEGGFYITYSNFVPYLIKAIQELSAKVTALENA